MKIGIFYTDRSYALKGKAQEMHFSDLLDHISFQGAGKAVGNGLAYPHLTDEVTEAQRGEVASLGLSAHFSLLT